MVSTRRSKTVEGDGRAEDMVPNGKSPTPTAKRQSGKTRSKEVLKSKTTGVGISITIHDDAAKENKKIVFYDDEDVAYQPTTQEPIDESDKDGYDPATNKAGQDSPTDIDDDNDDAVEEVKGSAARQEILQQLEAEVKGASKSKKKKKRKDPTKGDAEKDDDNDDDLDDQFFAKLETIKAEEEEKKKTESKKKKKGKHTTFVFGEDGNGKKVGDSSAPKKVGHNIQVVVLAEHEDAIANDPFTAIPSTALTKEALLFSGSDLKDGTDRGGKRKRNASNLPDTSWKRSRKMNLVITPKSRFNRRGGRGCPAANFATKNKS